MKAEQLLHHPELMDTLANELGWKLEWDDTSWASTSLWCDYEVSEEYVWDGDNWSDDFHWCCVVRPDNEMGDTEQLQAESEAHAKLIALAHYQCQMLESTPGIWKLLKLHHLHHDPQGDSDGEADK